MSMKSLNEELGFMRSENKVHRIIAQRHIRDAVAFILFDLSLKFSAPIGLSPPIDPVSITGYVIQLQWQRPSGNTGLLTQYILSAYNLDLPDIAPVQAVFTDTTFSENIGKGLCRKSP